MPRQLQNILRAYQEFTEDNEACPAYHLWIALGTIAGAAQRKILMRTAYFDVHTNMYILLVSPPGVGKKSTAMRVGKNFLKGVEPKVNFATESGSPEGLIGLLSKIQNPKHQSATVYVSELGTLMSTRTAEMVDFLTDIFDGNPDWSRQTVGHALQTIKHPWLNLMCGTTDEWISKHITSVAIEGGLMARTIIVYSDELILKSSFPQETDTHRRLRKAIINDLSHIANLEFEFGFTPEAMAAYDEWYMDKSRFPATPDYRVASYYARKHIHVLKVAMALSLAESDSAFLEPIHIKTAIMMLDELEPGMKKAFRMVGKNQLSTDTERVFAQIAGKGKLSYGELLALNIADLGYQELNKVLEDLRLMGRVRVDSNRTFFIATN